MYASCVRGENPRTVMSRIIRSRSALMSHLRQESWDGGDCEPGSAATSGWDGAGDHAVLTRARAHHKERDRTYRVSGLVQRLGFYPSCVSARLPATLSPSTTDKTSWTKPLHALTHRASIYMGILSRRGAW